MIDIAELPPLPQPESRYHNEFHKTPYVVLAVLVDHNLGKVSVEMMSEDGRVYACLPLKIFYDQLSLGYLRKLPS